MSYVEWDSAIASANVVKEVIEERLGYTTEILPVSAIAMWESVAAGDRDGMVAAWMPGLHKDYYEEHKVQLENLGPNLKGAVTGLAVPDYVPVNSIEELKEHANAFDNEIVGIDPGAGIMAKTNEAMESYDLNHFNLVTGSGSTMTQTLANAIEEERWVVITGWTPHWKFARWGLKYLEDPRNVYGEGDNINTMVRKGLHEDKPDVYNFLDRFYWESSDMEQVMLWAREVGTTPEEAAERWVRENKATVDTWVNQSK
ncbi:glycine betaine ABC transporter substrate-binding protein [Lentibacillus salinarum]|uniref:Glycine betaine ABC transporter substrate-binding protein n=1 Tax=Lentibacillus salinarum TaxID=446820 RepID=A0ABW3ZRT8_9BACI